MTRQEAIDLIDARKNKLIDPVEMLRWTWLRVIISHIDYTDWDNAVDEAEKDLSR
jgi:hypothetical protein